MAKSKKPHGFTITRNGKKFTCTWKKGSGMGKNDYKAQKFEYWWNGKWHPVSCGKKTFSKTISLNNSDISKKSNFNFRISAKWGSKKSFHGPYGPDNFFEIKGPNKFKISVTSNPGSENWPKTTCTWYVNNNANDHYPFTNVKVYTAVTDSVSKEPSSWTKVKDNSENDSSYTTSPEDTSAWYNKDYARVRWFKVVVTGWGGRTTTKIDKHVYARPALATSVEGRLVKKTEDGSGYSLNIKWNAAASVDHPVDNVTPKYAIVVPTTTVTTPQGSDQVVTEINCPDDAQWVSLNTVWDPGWGAATIDISSEIPDNSCIYVQVETAHDKGSGGSSDQGVRSTDPVLVPDSFKRLSTLPAPTVTPPQDPSVPIYNIALSSNPAHDAISGSFVAIYYRLGSKPSEERLIGIIPHDDLDNSQDVRLPAINGSETVSFGVKAYVADYKPATISASSVLNIEISHEKSESSGITWTDAVPLPPKLTINVPDGSNSSLEVTWNWTWDDATSAELSWADHEDAWESTDVPQTFEITNRRQGRCIISGLSVGEWFVRIRLIKTEGDVTVYGTYSKIYSKSLAESPAIPSIWVSNNAMAANGSIIVSWAYVTNDGTPQQSAWITEASYDNEGHIVYNESNFLETTGSQQHATLYAKDLIEKFNWQTGSTHYIAVKVSSASGQTSDNWSLPQAITIVESSVCQITAHSLESETESRVVDDHITYDLINNYVFGSGEEEYLDLIPQPAFTFDQNGYLLVEDDPDITSDFSLVNGDLIQTFPEEVVTALYLEELPLHVTVTGAGINGTVTVAIERYADYHVDRPDESEYDGFEGETIALVSKVGDGELIIDQSDLLGYLDDGAQYRIVATTIDEYGQVSESSLLGLDPSGTTEYFTVKWDRQAIIPDGEFEIDQENKVAIITPIAPLGWELGDKCDIYRLSADRPELIMAGADFGIPYVDPYPTLGKEFSGYRIVYKSIYGDYIADSDDPNEMPVPAWIDMNNDEEEDRTAPYLNVFGIIVDFGGDQVMLPYNVDISNTWKKDFQMTKYLGGSVQGDWNPAVERTSSLNTVTAVLEDPDTIRLIRKLADYAGICHIRTPDGSSFAANVDVKESRSERWVSKLANISLDVTRVESQKFDAMTYQEWISTQ